MCQRHVPGSPQQPQQSYQSTHRKSNTSRNNVVFRFDTRTRDRNEDRRSFAERVYRTRTNGGTYMDEWYIGSFLQSVRLIRLVFFILSIV